MNWPAGTSRSSPSSATTPLSNDRRTPRLTSRTAVAALQHMVDCVKYASPGVQSYDFTVSTDAFSAGKTAMMMIWSTIAGPVYNPKASKVASKVGVAVPPVKGQAVRGGWGMGIPKNAPAGNKDDLKPGTRIFVSAAKKQPDGTVQTPRITYGRNGAGPAF